MDQLLRHETMYFRKRFVFYIGGSLVLWGLLIFSTFALVLAVLFTLYALFKMIMMREDVLFLQTIIHEYQNGTLEEYIEQYYTDTKEQLSNHRSADHAPSISRSSSQYNYYKSTLTDSTKKYEMNVILQIKKIMKSTTYQKEQHPDSIWDQ